MAMGNSNNEAFYLSCSSQGPSNDAYGSGVQCTVALANGAGQHETPSDAYIERSLKSRSGNQEWT